MADQTAAKPAGVWPTVKPFVNGGASGMLATCVIQPIDMIKVSFFLYFDFWDFVLRWNYLIRGCIWCFWLILWIGYYFLAEILCFAVVFDVFGWFYEMGRWEFNWVRDQLFRWPRTCLQTRVLVPSTRFVSCFLLSFCQFLVCCSLQIWIWVDLLSNMCAKVRTDVWFVIFLHCIVALSISFLFWSRESLACWWYDRKRINRRNRHVKVICNVEYDLIRCFSALHCWLLGSFPFQSWRSLVSRRYNGNRLIIETDMLYMTIVSLLSDLQCWIWFPALNCWFVDLFSLLKLRNLGLMML